MCSVHGDKCFTKPATHVWCKKFPRGRESVLMKKTRRVVSTTDAAIAYSLSGVCQ